MTPEAQQAGKNAKTSLTSKPVRQIHAITLEFLNLNTVTFWEG